MKYASFHDVRAEVQVLPRKLLRQHREEQKKCKTT